jgi:hypothetical protein
MFWGLRVNVEWRRDPLSRPDRVGIAEHFQHGRKR